MNGPIMHSLQTSTKYILVCFLSFSVFACGSSHRKGKIQNIFIHGDPLVLVKGAATDDNTFFTVDNIGDFKGFNLSSGALFRQREAAASASSPEEGQEATT